ncbi:putative kinase activator [Diaporthe ampelina]|uniref:Autophagy-related protein 17 n=1 Tax=Diaporthe ampelina TaxID=1214573 RepID=A0A0G2FLG0_9PEZI|nr:putative kinase activator [Diaporthe ampelina]
MAASSASLSPANSRHGSSLHAAGPDDQLQHHGQDGPCAAPVPVEVLVEYLLAAKRALSSMTLVLRANDLTTYARQLHEESVILRAQTTFLNKGITEQRRLLNKVRRSMIRTYDAGKKEFKHIIKTLDVANGKLEATMDMLRKITVDAVFRPDGEEPKNLLDFVDENQVHGMREALKASIAELQATQTSFDGDLFRFDDDLRAIAKILNSSASPTPSKSPADSTSPQPPNPPILDLLAALTNHSHSMAEHLASLTHHFDMCVTAVRITEGGTALARRKAAEDSGGADAVSISGVIAEQEANVSDLDPEEKAEIVQVVLQDAAEVEEVVADLNAEMQQMDVAFAQLKDQADHVRAGYAAVMQAFQVLEDIGSRLSGYIAAETEFAERWEAEKEGISARLVEMESLRDFYEGYASAYDSLILEVERRRAVEEKIQAVWRKAKEQADKLMESDWRDREAFRSEVGEYLPTDLWVGMSGPLRRWEVVRAREREGGGEGELPAGDAAARGSMPRQDDGSSVTLSREVIDAARERIRTGASEVMRSSE